MLDTWYFDLLADVFSRHPRIEQAILYGSRAKGTHHTRSDIDVQHYEELRNPALREHIDRVGVIIWSR